MDKSIFHNYLAKFFPKLQRLIETINGKRDTPLEYFFKKMLRTEYSPDNKWESDTINTTFVAADYVAEDSEAPLKSRDSIATANGKLPKVSIARQMKESEFTKLRIMEAQGGQAQQIAQRLANDPIACATGIDELNEFSFLSGFYNGYVAVKDDENPNALLRLNFNYPKKNTYNATVNHVIDLDDIKEVIKHASDDGNTIKHIAISKAAYDELRKTQKARQLVADYNGQTYDSSTLLPIPTPAKFNDAFKDETSGVDFTIIDRSVIKEANGKRTPVKPFGNDRLIFYCNDVVGTLVYGRLAEQDHPVENVDYSTVDVYKLIARFRQTNPLREMTTGQAFVAPIIEDVDQIYVLELNTSAEVDETAETADTNDEYVTVNAKTYQKPGFINLLKKYGVKIASNANDETVIKKFNTLNDEDSEKLLAEAESILKPAEQQGGSGTI